MFFENENRATTPMQHRNYTLHFDVQSVISMLHGRRDPIFIFKKQNEFLFLERKKALLGYKSCWPLCSGLRRVSFLKSDIFFQQVLLAVVQWPPAGQIFEK